MDDFAEAMQTVAVPLETTVCVRQGDASVVFSDDLGVTPASNESCVGFESVSYSESRGALDDRE